MRRILAAALVIVPLRLVQAQGPAAPRNPTWVTLGMGRATWGGLTELGGQLTASHQTGSIVLTGRGLIGFDFLGGALTSEGTVVDVQDLGVMAGLGSHPGLFHYSFGAGIGYTTVTRKGVSSDVKRSTVGMPLETQLFFQPLHFVGVGFYGYGDLNKERSFWGWSISVALGRLR